MRLAKAAGTRGLVVAGFVTAVALASLIVNPLDQRVVTHGAPNFVGMNSIGSGQLAWEATPNASATWDSGPHASDGARLTHLQRDRTAAELRSQTDSAATAR
jgi:hypothetical protein